ncbi:MAG: HDOD domain-containing protein [Pseudomonadota bacterium]
MTTIAIEDVIKKIQNLPSLPAVVIELLNSMDQEDIDTSLLAEKIALDQSLAAKTLRVANSSFYGMQSKVTTIHQAISILGFHSIRTLVTAAALTGSFPSSGSGFDFQSFWRHSIGTAVCAKFLARQLAINQEFAFTAGLLHDIGRLVLVTRFPVEYEAAAAHRLAHDCTMIEAETAVLGIDHALIGSSLAAYWKFPLAMQNAVATHHALPEKNKVSLGMVVHVANTFAHALDLSGAEEDLVPPLAQEV